MGASRIIIIAVSAIAAIGLALILRGMVSRPAPAPAVAAVVEQHVDHPTVQVLVAKRELSVGTRLTSSDLGWQAWPADGLNGAFITDGKGSQAAPTTPVAAVASKTGQVAAVAVSAVTGGPMEALYGAMVRQPILLNEPITNAKLLRAGDGGYMAVVLNSGMRAISIPITVNNTAGGFILPGDHVDVMQARQADAAASGGGGHVGFVTSTLLRNIRVLAIDQASQPIKGAQTMIGAVATLEVAADDAKILTTAKAQGEIILALRPFADAAEASGRASGGDSGAVRIIRNGQISEMTVSR